jgi:ABC-type amino acid transport substrate-binding protein
MKLKLYTINTKKAFTCSVQVLALLLCTMSVVSAQALKGDTYADAKKNGAANLTIAFYETAGLIYKGTSGQVEGVCVDLINNFAEYVEKKEGVKVNYQFKGNGENFNSFYNSVKAGSDGVVGLGNVTITDARKKEISFSPPFMTNIAVLMTHNNVPTIAKLESVEQALAGKTAYVPKGTTHEKRMLELKAKHYKDMKVVTTSSSMEALEKMLDDPNGFCFQDMALYLEAFKRNKTIKRHPVADSAGEQFGIIMPQGSDWAPLMNEFMKSYRADPKYKQSIIKHMGLHAAKMLEQVEGA